MENSEILKATSILYVEDHELVRTSLAQLLRRRCREVFEAGNGEEGLELYRQHCPDIVVTDVEMPVMNGLEMIDLILRMNTTQPIIITTGYNDDDHKSDKVCANLVKPIEKDELLSAIIFCVQKGCSG